jgi:hypothetical protein
MFAAENGHTGVLGLLLATGKVDWKYQGGQAPLSLAAISGHWGVVELLLATSSINVNPKDSFE